jgi:hypothetical protein
MPDFGLSEVLLPLIGGEAGLFGAAAPTVAGIGAGALEGGALGAGSSLFTGADAGQSALFGALGGGAIGGAGAAGLGTAGQIGAGAATGGIQSGAQGTDPLTGIAQGAAGGATAGLFGSGGGSSAVGAAGGAGGTGMPVDLTAGFSGTGTAGDAVFGSSPAFGTGTTGAGTGTGVSAGTGAGALDQYGLPDYSATQWAGSAGSGTGGQPDFTGAASDSTWLDRLFAGSKTGDFGGGGTGPTVTGGSGSGGFLDKLSAHPEMLLMAAPLAMNLLGGSSSDASMKALAQQAAETGSQAETNMAYMQSGTLPAGLQDTLRGATNAAKASVRSRYAQMGLAGAPWKVKPFSRSTRLPPGRALRLRCNCFSKVSVSVRSKVASTRNC